MRRHARVAQGGDPGLARRSFGAGDAPRCRMLMIRMPHPQRQDGYAGPAGEDHREDGTAHAGLDFGGDMRRPIGEVRQRVQREGCRIRSREAFECLADHGVPRCDRALASIPEGDEFDPCFPPDRGRSGWRCAVRSADQGRGCAGGRLWVAVAPGPNGGTGGRSGSRCAAPSPRGRSLANAVMRPRIAGSRVCGTAAKKIRLAQVVEPVICSLADKIPNMARRVVRRQELTQYVRGWHLFQPPGLGPHQPAVRLRLFRCLCDLLKRGASPCNATLWRTFPCPHSAGKGPGSPSAGASLAGRYS